MWCMLGSDEGFVKKWLNEAYTVSSRELAEVRGLIQQYKSNYSTLRNYQFPDITFFMIKINANLEQGFPASCPWQ